MLKYFSVIIAFIFFAFSSQASDFEETVKELLLKKMNNHNSVEVRFDSQSKLMKILEKESKIESIILSFFSLETKSFKVLTSFSGSEQIEIFGKFQAFFEVPVAARNIRFGEEISPDNIRIIRVKKLKQGENSIKDPDRFYGMEAKYNIRSGQVIKLSDLKKIPIIKENDHVTLLYTAKDITLKTLGIALSEGAVGEKIKVRNEKTGILVFGEVKDRNIVKVSASDDK